MLLPLDTNDLSYLWSIPFLSILDFQGYSYLLYLCNHIYRWSFLGIFLFMGSEVNICAHLPFSIFYSHTQGILTEFMFTCLRHTRRLFVHRVILGIYMQKVSKGQQFGLDIMYYIWKYCLMPIFYAHWPTWVWINTSADKMKLRLKSCFSNTNKNLLLNFYCRWHLCTKGKLLENVL